MAPRKRKAASTKTTPLTQSKRLSSLRAARSSLQDLDSRRRHYESVARRYVDTLGSAPPRRQRLPSFAGQSSANPPSPPEASPNPIDSVPASPVLHPDSRPIISAAALNDVLSLTDTPPEAQAVMRRLLTTLEAIPNAADDDSVAVGERISLQEDDDLESFSQTLATEPFLCSECDHVRLLGLCCLAEVFRIRAPNPPLDNRDMIPVCSAILEELCVMAFQNDPMDTARFSLLEQLATVKTLVIVSDFDHIVCDIFACFYALVRAHQPVKVRQYLSDILVSLLEEMESPSQDVLDAALAPLIPSLGYTALAVSLAESVIQRAARHIQLPLVQLLNASIKAMRLEPSATGGQKRPVYRKKRSPLKTSTMSAEESANLSQHHYHIADLIIKFNHLTPDLLVFVLPNLQDFCVSKDLDIRLAAVNLLARLFTSREEMTDSYPALFTEFLQLSNDLEAQVREIVVNTLGSLLLVCPRQRTVVDSILRERTHDSDEMVRVAAVRSIGKVFDFIENETLERMFSRVQDKARIVRSEALQQAVSFYTIPQRLFRTDSKGSAETKLSLEAGQVGSAPSSSSVDIPKDDPEDIVIKRMLRISSLPDLLVEACLSLRNTKEFRSALDIELAIFEKICLPPSRKEKGVSGRGLRRMALFLAQLSPPKLLSFVATSRERALARRELFKVCNLRLEPRAPPNGTNRAQTSMGDRIPGHEQSGQIESAPKSRANIEEARNAAKGLAFCLNSGPGHLNDVQEQCLQLATAVDLKVFERCLTAIDCSNSETVASEAAVDAVARLGSKSATGKFCASILIPRCRPFIFSSAVLETVCRYATDIVSMDREGVIKSIKKEFAVGSSSSAGVSTVVMNNGGPSSRIEVTAMVLVGLIRYMEMIGPQYQDALISATAGVKKLITCPVSSKDWSAEVVLAGLRLGCNIPKGFLCEVDDCEVGSALRSIITCREFKRLRYSSLMVKRATQLIILMWEGECSKVITSQDLLSEIMTMLDSFDGNVEQLIAPLASLCQFAKRTPDIYRAIAMKSFDFARALLGGSMNKIIHDHLSKSTTECYSRFSEISDVLSQDIARRLGRGEVETLYNGIDNDFRLSVAEVTSRSSKLLAYGLHHVDFKEEMGNVAETLTTILNEQRGDVFEVTRDAMSTGNDQDFEHAAANDDVSLTTVSDAVMCACNRLSIGRAILYLARKKEFFMCVSPEKLVTTLLVAQDEHPLVRLCFARCVQLDVARKCLPIRWTVSMALMAVDPVNGNVAKVKKMLTRVFQHRRKLCEIAAQKRTSFTSQFLPESTIADLIWVLSNLPAVEIEQECGYPESSKCVEFLIDCLCESKEYANILNEFIGSVCIAEDATEPVGGGVKTERLKDMCRIASKALQKRLLGRKLDLEHTGRIELPRDLYRVMERRTGNGNALRPKLLDMAIKYDEGRGIKRPGGSHGVHAVDEGAEAVEITTRHTSRRLRENNITDDTTEVNHGPRQRKGNAKTRGRKKQVRETEESLSSRMKEAATGMVNGVADGQAVNGNNDEEEVTAVVVTKEKRGRRPKAVENVAQAEGIGDGGSKSKRKRVSDVGDDQINEGPRRTRSRLVGGENANGVSANGTNRRTRSNDGNVDADNDAIAVVVVKKRTRQHVEGTDSSRVEEKSDDGNVNKPKRQKVAPGKARRSGGSKRAKGPATPKGGRTNVVLTERSGMRLRRSARKRIQRGDDTIGNR